MFYLFIYFCWRGTEVEFSSVVCRCTCVDNDFDLIVCLVFAAIIVVCMSGASLWSCCSHSIHINWRFNMGLILISPRSSNNTMLFRLPIKVPPR